MRRLLVFLLSVSLVFGFPAAGFAAGPSGSSGSDEWKWFWEGGEKKWLPQFELTARPGNHHFHGMEMDPLFPIGQSGHSMAYINPRGSTFWDHGDFLWELNVGGGYRHIMGDDSWILGGYAFYDRLESRWDNTFNQGTLGIEAMAWDWDARVNGYIADDDPMSAFGAGGSQVTLSGTALSMKTMQEQAMSGLDGEVGWRIPFFGDDGVFSDMRIYAGGFYFDADLVDSIAGPSARFEHRIWDVPFMPAESRVVLGANYTWDDVRQSRVQGIIALRVPLGRPNRSQPLTHLERRMTDRVVRDVNIVTNTGLGNKEDVMTRTGVTIEDAIFFDEDGGGDGTFENPYDLPTAVATGENNLLIGLARTGDVNVDGSEGDLLDGQTVLGGGMPLYVWGVDSGQDGVWVAPGEAATLCCIGTALTLADNNTIAGLFFDSMGRALELNLNNQTTMLDVYNNHFSGMEHALEIDVENDSGLTAWVWDNRFQNMESGVDVWAPDTFDLNFDIYGNHFTNLGTGLEFTLRPDGSAGASSFALNAVDNDFVDVTSGIETDVVFSGTENYSHNSYIGMNRFWSNRFDDYELTIEGAAPTGEIDVNVELDGNESLNGDTFADIEVDPIPNGQVTFDIHNNRLVGDEQGIDIDVDDGPDVNVVIHQNEIIGTWGDDAVNVDIHGSGDANGNSITITENWIENTFDDDGIDIHVQDSADTVVSVIGNTIIDTGDDGDDNAIEIEFDNVGDDTGNSITVAENKVEFVNGGANNIQIEVDDSYDTDIDVYWNVLSHNDNGHAIELDLVNTGHDSGNTVTISENVIEDIDDTGIDLWLDDLNGATTHETTVAILDNQLRHVGQDGDNGIEIDLNNVTYGDITLMGNTIEEAGDDDNGHAIEIGFDSSDDNTVTIADNTISRTGEHGIEMDLTDDSDDNVVAINDNEIELTDENGIDIYVENGSGNNEIGISGNEISYVEDGVQIDSFDATTMIDSDSDNTVTYYLDDAADIDGTGTGEITVNGAQYGF